MESQTAEYPNVTGGGRLCPSCNCWVPYGTYHNCQQPNALYFPWLNLPADEGIKRALERIADALEKLLGDKSKQ